MIFIRPLIISLRIAKLVSIIIYEFINYIIIKSINNVYKIPTHRLELIKALAQRLEYENIVYVKLFQALCLNKDLLYSDEQDFLIKYTDNVPYSISDINYDLLNKLQCEYCITLNNAIPINSGIVGLIFDARDCCNNKLIVKMLKQNILKKFTNVFDELLYVSYICKYIPYIKYIKITKLLLDNREILLNQMNFIKEVDSLELFSKKYKNNKEYRFPKVYKMITEKYPELMVMENINGLKLKDIATMDPPIKEEFAYLLNKFNILGILYHSVIHCDLHCGNVFFYINDVCDLSNNETETTPKYMLGLIDFGLCTFPTKESQNAYYIFFNNMFYNNDYSSIEYLINTFIEEKELFNTYNNNIKQVLCNETINCLDLYASHSISNQALVNKLGALFYNYDLNFTREFNRVILSLHTTYSFITLLSSNVNECVEKVIKELNYFNELINI
jgi:predicted unusual protein kinase regulating ubiquinone biosynthesis (AarF/ABC1/UbiB family)